VIIFLGVLILIVRPAAVFVSTLKGNLNWKERIFLASVAPRGIVAAAISSIFALRLEETGHLQAGLLISSTFIVIISTVAIYGLAAPILAKKLGVADSNPQGFLILGAQSWARSMAEIIQKKGYRVLLVDTNRHNIAIARMAGIPTYTESILSEYVLDDIDLNGIGRILALTPNDWVNVLAVQRFEKIFGRAEVYQLTPSDKPDRGKNSHEHLFGRQLFRGDRTFKVLEDKFAYGGVIKATPLTEEFNYEDFRKQYSDSATLLFVIEETGKITPITTDQKVEPGPGQTLISLIEPDK